MTDDKTPIVGMEPGLVYQFNFAGSPPGSGTFEGWTDFGWLVFTDRDGETRFYNLALLCTLRPERFDSAIAGTWQE